MSAGWIDVGLDELGLPDWGFRRRDEVSLLKLAESLTHHGQAQALVTYEEGGRHVVLDGRLLLEAMRRLGTFTHAHIRSLGQLTRLEAMRVALSLENRSETDYVRLAGVVGELAATYEDAPSAAAALARTTPFSPEQLEHYVTLLTFDWEQFAETPDEQHGFDWGALGEAEPAPGPATAEEGTGSASEAAMAPLEGLAEVPRAECPRCGAQQDDLDGFGVLRCAACGYCTHASVTGGTCGLCHERVPEDVPDDLPTYDGPEDPAMDLPLEIQPGLFGD